jgi:hypothetical protein
MPWLNVNQTRLLLLRAVPTPTFALEVQRGVMPGAPGAESFGASKIFAPLALLSDQPP